MSNTPNYDKTALTDELSSFNYIIGNYLNNNLFTINIVKIKTIKENSVDVVPVIQQKTSNNTIIELTSDNIIHNVPVLFLSSGNCSISFKLNEDDYGFLFTTKDDSNNFIKTLQTSTAGSYKQFNINSSFFIPFQILNIKSSIIIKNNTSQVEVTENEINITAENINIIGNSNIKGNTNIDNNLIIKETTKSKEIIAENGATGTFVDTGVGASGLTLVINNGIITGIE